jgi:pilus assembly protein CpaF
VSSPGSLALIIPFLGDGIAGLLADDRITEVMVNADRSVWTVVDGRILACPTVAIDPKRLVTAIRNIAATCGGDCSENEPILSARLEDGSRVQAVYPPVSVGGPTLSIRKFPRRYTAEELLLNGTLSADIICRMQQGIEAHLNTLIVGGPGTGKTTLLNMMASEMFAVTDRVIVIEDTSEIRLTLPNLVRLEAQPASRSDPLRIPAVTMADCVVASLRFIADRLVVGEVRDGAAAAALLQALNTGHDASLTTIHANTPQLGLTRFAHLVMQAHPAWSYDHVRESIGATIGMVVHLRRATSGQIGVTDVLRVEKFSRARGAFTFAGQSGVTH